MKNWSLNKFAEQKKSKNELLEEARTGSTTYRVWALKELEKLPPDLDIINAFLDGLTETNVEIANECIEYLGKVGPSHNEQVQDRILDALVYVLKDQMAALSVQSSGPRRDKFEFALDALVKFKDKATHLIPMLREMESQVNRGTPFNSDLLSAISALSLEPGMMDELLISSNAGTNVELWKKLRNQVIPGRKVKVLFHNAPSNAITMGEIKNVRYDILPGDERKPPAQQHKIPVVTISFSTETTGRWGDVSETNSEAEINLAKPKADVWLSKDIEKIPLSDYKGMWVSITDDHAVTKFVGGHPGSSTYAILMKIDGDVATVKIMKNDVPYVLEIPTAHVRPTIFAPLWGQQFLKNKTQYSIGDVVQFENKEWLVSKVSPRQVGISPLRGAGQFVYVKPEELKYLGQFNVHKGVSAVPDFKSPSLKKPVQPAMPAPDSEV